MIASRFKLEELQNARHECFEAGLGSHPRVQDAAAILIYWLHVAGSYEEANKQLTSENEADYFKLTVQLLRLAR